MDQHTLFLALCALFAVAQAADLWLTDLGLELGARETETVASRLIEWTGSVWLAGGLVKGLTVAAVYFSGSALLAAFCAGFMVNVCYVNWRVIRRLRDRVAP